VFFAPGAELSREAYSAVSTVGDTEPNDSSYRVDSGRFVSTAATQPEQWL